MLFSLFREGKYEHFDNFENIVACKRKTISYEAVWAATDTTLINELVNLRTILMSVMKGG